MADIVNGQVTDGVTQSNLQVVGESPAMAMSTVYQTMAQSLSLAMQNATYGQQQMQAISQAITTVGSSKIMAILDDKPKI